MESVLVPLQAKCSVITYERLMVVLLEVTKNSEEVIRQIKEAGERAEDVLRREEP